MLAMEIPTAELWVLIVVHKMDVINLSGADTT